MRVLRRAYSASMEALAEFNNCFHCLTKIYLVKMAKFYKDERVNRLIGALFYSVSLFKVSALAWLDK